MRTRRGLSGLTRNVGLLAAGERRKFVGYLIVGSTGALGYLVIACYLENQLGFSPVSAGISTYLALMPLTYLGHRRHTFCSLNRGLAEPGRFALWSLIAVALSGLIPGAIFVVFGSPAWIGYLVVCIAVPLSNYIVMNSWVFRQQRINLRDIEAGR